MWSIGNKEVLALIKFSKYIIKLMQNSVRAGQMISHNFSKALLDGYKIGYDRQVSSQSLAVSLRLSAGLLASLSFFIPKNSTENYNCLNGQ